MTLAQLRDKFGNVWQYHSRSDNHSKIACWTLLFDLIQECPLLTKHILARKVGFGINHEMWDFQMNRSKRLDLVLCTIGTDDGKRQPGFAELADRLKVNLLPKERSNLSTLPALERVPVGTVYVAVEAKACMTEHVKALPRLYDELNSSQLAIHGSADFAIAVGFAMVNFASTFVSTDKNRFSLSERPPIVTKHRQPAVTSKTIAKLEQIPRRTQGGVDGFDALGIVVVDMVNDGSPVRVVNGPPAPQPQEPFHYDQMVRRIASLYESKFGNT